MRYILIFLVLLISCSKDDVQQNEPDYTEQNEKEIQNYLKNNNLTAQKSSTGLYYIIDEVGSGKTPNANATVTFSYKGYFTNGNVFDQSTSDGIKLKLTQLIPGFSEGLTKFKEGGNGVLLIPSRLGYGNRQVGNISPGSVLVFDVKLISVE